jgi:hypothetical protein
MNRAANPRWPWATLLACLLTASACRSIPPPAPKYDVNDKDETTDEVPPKPGAKADSPKTEDESSPPPPPVVASRKSLCEEPTIEMQAWNIEEGTEVDYTLCRADRPVDDIEVGFRWRHARVEMDILKNPDPVDPNHDELSIFLTNVHEAPLEIRVKCDAVAPEARNEVCKSYQSGQMVNFDIECVARAEVGASGDSYELAVTISPAAEQATVFKFTAGALTGDCGD